MIDVKSASIEINQEADSISAAVGSAEKLTRAMIQIAGRRFIRPNGLALLLSGIAAAGFIHRLEVFEGTHRNHEPALSPLYDFKLNPFSAMIKRREDGDGGVA